MIRNQEATYTVSMYVTYDVVEYLVDSKSQNILYYNEKLVSNGKGGSVKVDGEQKTGWVSTGDSFNIHVNDLGTVETNGSATKGTVRGTKNEKETYSNWCDFDCNSSSCWWIFISRT